jgi:hypothetical protein
MGINQALLSTNVSFLGVARNTASNFIKHQTKSRSIHNSFAIAARIKSFRSPLNVISDSLSPTAFCDNLAYLRSATLFMWPALD